ncbi:hypothetical protein KM043_006387 [Ampulex compressa]|nr:hypothetical protein KM043_006387 [Ampulex compressa]
MAADTVAPSALTLARGDKILVTVESALPDIVVVSFVHGAKCFQGALLDATKRGLPCGVQPPEPVPDPDGDKLATIAARFSYFQERKSSTTAAKVDLRRSINPPARYKNARPTVRLRPRQVLCSKCRSICNENSENVDVSRKRKHEDIHQGQHLPQVQQQAQQQQQHQQANHGSTRRSDRRCSQQPQKTQRTLLPECQADDTTSPSNQATAKSSSSSSLSPDSSKLAPSLIPKLSRLQPNEISSAMQGTGKVKIASGAQSSYWASRSGDGDSSRNTAEQAEERVESTDCDSNPSMAYCATPRRLSSSSVESAKIPDEDEKKTFAAADSTMRPRTGRVPRKKRSVGSMEDLWDESVFEDPMRTARATPVIKISFGAQGEGTVLKIPSKIQDPEYEQETDDQEDAQAERDPLELPRNFENDYDYRVDGEEDGQEQVDPQKQGVKDASAKAAKRALKRAKKEARRKMLGGVSPARSPCNGSPRYNPTYDPLSYHRRKHKVKHKKKHKEDRKHKNQQQALQQQEACLGPEAAEHQQNWNVLPDGESYTAIKEQCLKQKLSISLKRLNTNAYARCDYPVSNASSGCKSPGASSDELSEQEPEIDAGETAPDFPPQSHPLVMRLAATPVAHCLTANGRRMDVGDVVWGKIHGFPWWPGKVLSITVSCKEDGTSSGPQAHVAWYGSSTSSLMSCDQLSPFLETFKTRYNKKKRGPYKEAIRQAQNEARSQITPNSTSSVLNVCGSPRESAYGVTTRWEIARAAHPRASSPTLPARRIAEERTADGEDDRAAGSTLRKRIMIHVSSENAQRYERIKRKGVAFLTSLFKSKRSTLGMKINEDDEMERAPRVETPAIITNACRRSGSENDNQVSRIPSTLSVAAVDVVVACQPSPSHSILTLTPGRTRNIDQDMEALRLSRQDNPFLQVLASRESLVESVEESESDDAILMSQELGDADPLTLAQVHEHLVRSPPPASWPHATTFHFPHQNQNSISKSDVLEHYKSPSKTPSHRGNVNELSRSEPSTDIRDRHSHPFSLLHPTPIRSLSEVRRLHRSADDSVQLMSSE